jgi:HEAT repeat protein
MASGRRNAVWAWRVLGLLALVLNQPSVAAEREGRNDRRDYAADLASPEAAVRIQAAAQLGRNGDKAGTTLLLSVLQDREPAVRREAAKALGAIKDSRSVPALIEALRDDDTNVRMYAAYALGEIKEVRAVDALLRAVRDAQWCVRDHAAWALRELRDPALAERYAALVRDEAVQVATAAWILRGLGDEAVLKAVTPLLRTPQPATRLRAVRALRELRTTSAVDLLLGTLQDADAAVRRSAVEALAKTPGPTVKRALTGRLAIESDVPVRSAIEKQLQEVYPAAKAAAWWSFDDQNPHTARDVTGRGSDGEIRRCTPVAGKVGAALKFAEGSCISLGKVPKLPLAHLPLTVMAWVKPEADRGVVVARGGAACGYSLYLLDGVPKFGIHREQAGPAYIAAGREQVGHDWLHLAGVIKSDAIELYVNGKLAARARTDGFIPGNAGQGMEIGCDLGNSPAEITDSFTGTIDEVKVFSTALNDEELRQQCGIK